MASKADLITVAQALGVKLGEDVETTDLTNAELVTLVAGLRARVDAAATVTGAGDVTVGLVAEVKGLADALGAPVVTEGVSDEGLREMIDNLTISVDEAAKAAAVDGEAAVAAKGAAKNEAAKDPAKRDAEADAQAAADAAVSETLAAVAAQEKPPFYIMPGKAITSLRGILGPGEEVKAEYLSGGGGQKALDGLIKSGHIGRR